MSFRVFVYYCALVGAWTGIVGWALGRYVSDLLIGPEALVLQNGLRGLFLGVCVSLGLGLIDALWNVGWRQIGQILGRLFMAITIGAFGGFVGGAAARWLISFNERFEPAFFVMGWTLAGLLMGASIGSFEWLSSQIRRTDRSARMKFWKCTAGGCVGGLVGGLAAYWLRVSWTELFADKDESLLWSPSAIGFVTLGMFIGLLVGAVQVFLKKAWIRVEAGFRAGRELILTKDVTRIGRAEGSEIALFGDQGVEKTHAQIRLEGVRYLLEDVGSAGGTFVNDKKVTGRVALQSGDLIRVGRSVLRFQEKAKR